MTDNARPQCPNCGAGLKCPSCDDLRPKAEEVYDGWRILSPFDRWELIERVDRPGGEYGPVLIYTAEVGPAQPWTYPRWVKVDATPPLLQLNGTPIVRVYEAEWADGPMYAYACLDTDHRRRRLPGGSDAGVLVEARTRGRGHPWQVQHRPGGAPEIVVTEHDSKAKARSELRRLAREFARLYKVKVVLPEKPEPRR